MIDMFFAYILHAKIVYDEGKADRVPLVGPKTGCLVVLRAPEKFQPFFQKILGYNSGIWEVIHPFFYPQDHESFLVNLVLEVVLIYAIIWEVV